MNAVTNAALLGALSGLRSMAGLAAVGHGLAQRESPTRGLAGRLLGRPAVAGALRFAAMGEVVADKMPFMGPRTDPLPLAGRVAFGALAAGVGAGARRQSRIVAAIIGGAAAFAAAHAAYHLRRDLTQRGLPDPIVALAEDVTALEAACQGAAEVVAGRAAQ